MNVRSFIMCSATACTVLVASIPGNAYAGMPAIRFHDLVRLRLEVISFFTLGFLVSSVVVCWIWNSLRNDFRGLPRLSFARACGVVALWGLLFVVVLTMISGARELMTPGAWEPNGLTYELKADQVKANPPPPGDSQARMNHLSQLYAELHAYAVAHEGSFPPENTVEAIARDRLMLSDGSGIRLIYLPGRKVGHDSTLLAYEPTVFNGKPLALFSDGKIEAVDYQRILELRKGSSPQ
ncbi:hypothetical protein OAS39_08190 [Pirellulales bacterium]|nr:hypothetical protein [Pirellulales bacterium]